MKTNEQEFATEVDRELSTVIRNMTEQHGDGKFMISDLQNVRHKGRGNMPPDDVKGTIGSVLSHPLISGEMPHAA